jgi:CheY-like chemotaxis protein
MSAHRLLYVEDNPVNTLVVQELLTKRPDIELVCEEDASHGLARASAWRPQLVLLDMHLPDMDGFEVLQRLRADPVTAATPCIALSANAMPDDIDAALKAGFTAYWTKPIDFKAFYAGLELHFPMAVSQQELSLDP